MSEGLSQIRSTKAAILAQQHQPLIVDRIALPQSLNFGQVLVRIHYSGICGSQIGEIDGVKGPDRYLPHLLGHEGGGVVVETGAGVTRVKPGDHVVMHWRPGSGLNAPPATYTWKDRPLNAGWVTTFSEYSIISENRLTTIPADFDLAVAAMFGCPATTGLGVVNRNARIVPGESVIVLGAGGVGMSVIMGCRLVSAHPIVAVDLVEEKLSLARKLGATDTVNGRSANLAEELRKIVGPAGADAVIENTGRPELIELAYELTQPKGRTVLVGVLDKTKRVSLHTLALHFGKTLTGSHGGDAEPGEDIPRYIKLCKAGKLDIAPLVTDRVLLDDINSGIDKVRAGRVVGRCIIDMTRLSTP